jgi:subtilisin family serine protease
MSTPRCEICNPRPGASILLGYAWLLIVLCLACATLSSGAGLENKEKPVPKYAANQIIVKLKSGRTLGNLGHLHAKYKVVSARNAFANAAQAQTVLGAGLRERLEKRQKRAPKNAVVPSLENIYVIRVPQGANLAAMLAEYRSNPGVEYAQFNYKQEPYLVPNDPYYASANSWGQGYDDLWGLKANRMNCAPAWDIATGSGVIVAVVDTGVDYNHADLAANICRDGSGNLVGYDVSGNTEVDDPDLAIPDNDPSDDLGHGTHCAGIIAGVGNNGQGIIGVAPGAKIMPVKIFPNAYDNICAAGIKWAADNGADVLSCSWGPGSRLISDPVIEDALDYAYAKGCVLVFAAGNANDEVNYYSPANYPITIAVAATDHSDIRSTFSNYGSTIAVAAPGGDSGSDPVNRSILSLRAQGTDLYGDAVSILNQGYYRARGTSMACPHVSGLAALIIAAHPEFTNGQIKSVMEISADDVDDPGWDPHTGYGRINAYRALQVNSVLEVAIDQPKTRTNLREDSVTIYGTASGTGFSNYKLEYGAGLYPAQWFQIGATSSLPVTHGILGTWNVSALPEKLYTLRLAAAQTNGTKYLYAVTVCRTRNLMPGFPKNVGRSNRAPCLADINGDGKKEIVVQSLGRVHVLNLQGQELPHWPVVANSYDYALPVAADIDQDGQVEIIAAGDIDNCGMVYAFRNQDLDGNGLADAAPGFPVKISNGFSIMEASPTLFDINQDGYQEIIIGSLSGGMYLIDRHGTILKCYGYPAAGAIRSAAAVGDLNHDGNYRIVYRDDNGNIIILDKDLNLLRGWKADSGIDFSSPALADLDHDGKLEILVGSSYTEKVYAFKQDGSTLPGWPVTISGPKMPGFGSGSRYIAVGDLDLDGNLEVFTNGSEYQGLYAWQGNGTPLSGWPAGQDVTNWFDGPVTLADIDGDGKSEVVAGNCNSNIYAYKYDGSLTAGWPKMDPTCQYAVNAVQIADLNNDGKAELVTTVQDGWYDGSVLYWDLGSWLGRTDWPVFLHDEWHTGCYINQVATITPTPAATPPTSLTPTQSPTATVSAIATFAPTLTPTATFTATVSAITTFTPTLTPTVTFTATRTILDLGGRGVIAYPNPGRSLIHFAWQETGAESVRIRLYNVIGEKVAEIGAANPGQSLAWNAAAVAPGIYLYRVTLSMNGAEESLPIKKLAIIKP